MYACVQMGAEDGGGVGVRAQSRIPGAAGSRLRTPSTGIPTPGKSASKLGGRDGVSVIPSPLSNKPSAIPSPASSMKSQSTPTNGAKGGVQYQTVEVTARGGMEVSPAPRATKLPTPSSRLKQPAKQAAPSPSAASKPNRGGAGSMASKLRKATEDNLPQQQPAASSPPAPTPEAAVPAPAATLGESTVIGQKHPPPQTVTSDNSTAKRLRIPDASQSPEDMAQGVAVPVTSQDLEFISTLGKDEPQVPVEAMPTSEADNMASDAPTSDSLLQSVRLVERCCWFAVALFLHPMRLPAAWCLMRTKGGWGVNVADRAVC